MTTRYGVFSEPGYIGPGRPATHRDDSGDPSDKPIAFKYTSSKLGKNNDALFSHVMTLREPDRPREKRSGSSAPAFRPAGVRQADVPEATLERGPVVPAKKKGDIIHEERGMVGTAHKTGHWGAAGTTFTAFEHIAQPALPRKSADSEDSKLTPFKSAVHADRTVTGAMSDYDTELPEPAALTTSDATVEKLEPFRPGTASSRPFNKYPEHFSTPAAAKNTRKAAEDQSSLHSRSWIHTASNHSCATRSIVKMNIR